MPDHTTSSAAAYLTERGYTVHSKRDGTDLPPMSDTVKQWCERGKIKARKAGWVWLIDQAELDALIAVKKSAVTSLVTSDENSPPPPPKHRSRKRNPR